MFKSIAFAAPLMVLASSTALADQCQLIPKAIAQKAVPFFQKAGGVMQAYCPGCGDAVATLTKFKTVVARLDPGPNNDDALWRVDLDGENVDLAYAFVRVGNSKDWTSVAKLTGCPLIDPDTPTTLSPDLVDPGK